jgi:phosphatidylinositol alpha-1,6-mannosyltransferase
VVNDRESISCGVQRGAARTNPRSATVSRWALKVLALVSEFSPYRGGIASYGMEFASAATGLGIELTLVSGDYGDNNRLFDAALPFEVIRYRGGVHTAREVGAKVLLARKLCAQVHYDLIHAMDWPFFIPAALASTGTRMICSVHGSDILRFATGYRAKALQLAGVFSERCEVVANSAFTQKLFRKLMPTVPRSRSRASLLAVNPFWMKVPSAAPLRTDFGLPASKFVLVCTGRLVPRKNQLGLIRALEGLPPRSRQQICLAIVGPETDADYAYTVRAAAASSLVETHFFTNLDNERLRDLYRMSDLFVLMGQHPVNGPIEGFGLVYLEAAGQGLPSLATNVGGTPEVVLHGRTGLLVPEGDAEAFRKELMRLMEDADLRRRLGKMAALRALELTWARCVKETYGL